eukprot:GEZU01006873.1.p1 GENE.GEZU01006873.1~~GEZU01006873.1.p1  ORF type:complete len:265 (-),score=53.50 GEZU01006873.1:64-858(-)
MDATTDLPVFFISHGAPTMAIERDSAAHKFFKTMAKQHVGPTKPKAILVVSAHWEKSKSFAVTTKTDLVYDFYGFPDEMYRLKYPAPPSPWLSDRVIEILNQAQLPCVADNSRGIDHGTWVPLLLMYPAADIPVVQLSLHASLDPALHLRVGKALAQLRKEGVLIVCSGGATHNLGDIGWGAREPASWAKQFDEFVSQALASPDQAARERALLGFRSLPTAHRAHPREEHFTPIFVALGACRDKVEKIHSSFLFNLSLSSFKFT